MQALAAEWPGSEHHAVLCRRTNGSILALRHPDGDLVDESMLKIRFQE